MDNIKIKISEPAYEELKKALDNCPEYSFIRLAFSEGCSKSLKVEIILDNAKENDIKDKIEELPFLYDYNLASKVKRLTIVYRDFLLKIKTELYESITSYDSLSNKDCSKSSDYTNCSGCKEK